jgi:outer membrane receptor protein involved in Fe transport
MKTSSWAIFYLLGLHTLTPAYAEEPPIVELETIEVTETTPLSSSKIKTEKIPAHVQSVSANELKKSQSLSLADYMNQYLGSVTINETQNNVLQPDVYYRGFVASPLMGMPQGLSVYVNGTRFNEAFGDSVNWDLLPQNAIQTMTLHPGSNPVYGLNTLGGALSIRTKNGFDFDKPTHQLEVSGGSWGRHSEDLTSGGHFGQFGYFIDLNYLNEDGWRDFSPTEAKRALGSLSWRGEKGTLDLTVAANDNKMLGNGALPVQLYEEDSNAVFTHPDQTITRLFFSQLSGSYDVSKEVKLTANAYFRQNQMGSFNGDNGEAAPCNRRPGFLCIDSTDISTMVRDVNGKRVRANDTVEGAINNSSQTKMRGKGGSLQALFSPDLLGFKNNLTIGASYDNADVHYAADTELARLTANRGTIGSGIMTQEDRVRLNTNTETYGFYFTDSFSVTNDLTLTLAGRYNHTSLTMDNRYVIAGEEDKLSGKHNFERFNPSAGLTYQVNNWLNVYGNYSESARVPTPMELSCADVNDPCKLPNAFVADPPLAQVVAKTWEAGFRGSFAPLLPHKANSSWNLGYFHTVNHNDIIFIREGTNVSNGYFDNVGSTRRHGIETGLTVNYPQLFSDSDDWRFSTNYTYLNAQFMSGFDIQDPLNPDVGVKVSRGNRIPGLPEHIFKASVGVDLWKTWSLSVNGLYNSEQFFRGDEANTTAALTGYWLFNLQTEIKVNNNFAVFAHVNNLFDHKYETFGVYGDATEVLGDAYSNRRFVSPGAPRAGWVGIRLSL